MSTQQVLIPSTEHDTGCKRLMKVPKDVAVMAKLDGPYRYQLEHRWGMGSLVMFAMMNPSAADYHYTDATIAKCSRLAKRWGYGGILVGNACAYRATQQKTLLEVPDPVGPHNLENILDMADLAHRVVIAHGRLPGKLQIHATKMSAVLVAAGCRLHALRVLSGNCPAHPLYLPEDIEPKIWKGIEQ